MQRKDSIERGRFEGSHWEGEGQQDLAERGIAVRVESEWEVSSGWSRGKNWCWGGSKESRVYRVPEQAGTEKRMDWP